MLRRLSVAAALCLLSTAGSVQALGLGDIKVSSALNQRFSAVIPFTSLTADEAGNVRARIADNQDFDRAGVERSVYLSSVKVETVVEGSNPRIVLSGDAIVREPLLNLLIEVRTAGGPRILRSYTVLLDPPGVASTSAVPTEPAASASTGGDSEFFQTPEESGARTPAIAAAPRPAAPRASAPAPSVGPGESYGPVGSGETLWTVAQAVKPSGVGLDQVMLALYENNRSAFNGGDIDSLRRGATLTVPSVSQMQAVGNADARTRIASLSAQVAPEADTDVTTAEPAVADVAEPAMSSDPATSAPATSSSGDTASAGAESAPETGTSMPAEAAAATAADAGAVDPSADTAVDPTSDAAQVVASPTEEVVEEEVLEEVVAEQAEPAPAQGDWINQYLLPALIALILLLIAFAAWRTSRERKAQREYDEASRQAASPMPSPRPGATGVIAAKASAGASARDELEALNRRIDDEDATRVTAAEDPEKTRMVTTSRIPAYTGPVADRKLDEAERAVNSQFQANTKEIKLGDNDPLSEAEFHLAYGLYDEAALLLQQASAREPGRTDLRSKLAETYFAAGKSAEFEQTAAGLKEQLSADEWNKLAIMGRQIAPNSALFAGTAAATTGATALDFNFDDDATQIAPVKVDEGLEFNLDELELPTQTAGKAAADSNTLEFDLGEFDLGGDAKTKKAASSSELSLQDFDLGGSNPTGPGGSKLDIQLEDIDPMVIDDPLSDEALAAGNDAATKLDLARAYVEMGDSEMARTLLDEVAATGSDDQKREAGELRSRLLG